MATEQSSTPVYLTLAIPANASDLNKLSGLISNIVLGQERYADLSALRCQFEKWICTYRELLTTKKAEIDEKVVVSTRERDIREKYVKMNDLQIKISNVKNNIKSQNNMLDMYQKASARQANAPEKQKETNEKLQEVEVKLAKLRNEQAILEEKLHEGSDNNNDSEMKTITRNMLDEQYENIVKLGKHILNLRGEYDAIQSMINELVVLENKVNHMITHSLIA